MTQPRAARNDARLVGLRGAIPAPRETRDAPDNVVCRGVIRDGFSGSPESCGAGSCRTQRRRDPCVTKGPHRRCRRADDVLGPARRRGRRRRLGHRRHVLRLRRGRTSCARYPGHLDPPQPSAPQGRPLSRLGRGGRAERGARRDRRVDPGRSRCLLAVKCEPRLLRGRAAREDPHYTELVSDTTVGARYDVAVLEIASRPGWWRVWLNRAPSSSPIHLPGSSGRWRPSATAETWNGGSPVCNSFAFRFERVEVASAPGGSWKRLSAGARLQETGYRVDRDTDSTFSIFRTC